MNQKKFITPHLYPSCVISNLLDLQPAFRVENGWTLFCFHAPDDLYKDIAAYNNGIPINSYELCEKIKRVRGEIIATTSQKHDETGSPRGNHASRRSF
jgi:hypothetical protein